MSSRHVLVISERSEDIQFAQAFSEKLNARLVVIEEWPKILDYLLKNSECILFWDVDGEYSAEQTHPISRIDVNASLKGAFDPERIFSLSDRPLGQFPILPEKKQSQLIPLRQNILRRYNGAAISLLSPIGEQLFSKELFHFSSFFPNGTKIQTIRLKKSDHRHAAADAVQSVLSKLGIEDRIAAKVSQATDELLMNAIFDAARSSEGKPTRQMMSRSIKFDLQPFEQVDLEVAFSKDYVGVAVTDTFGSLDQEVLSRYLAQDFTGADYSVRRYSPGAGLGLYGILNSGISLFMACLREKKTMASLFFPNEPSFKKFKKGFQFSASVFRPISRRKF